MKHLVFLLFLSVAAVACTTVAEDEVWEPEEYSVGDGEDGSFAMLMLSSSDGTTAGSVDASAQFVRFFGPDSEWAMSVLDLWLPKEQETEGCRVALQQVSTSDGLPDYSLELLDAGELLLESSETVFPLDIHYVPDLQVYLSGIVYTLDTPLALESGTYRFKASGTEEIAPFEIDVPASIPASIVAVNGERPVESKEIDLNRTTGLTVEWEPASQPAMYIEIYDDARSASPQVSCAVRDDGYYRLPSSVFEELREEFPGAALRMVLRRANITEFELEGFAWAKAMFVSSDAVFLSVR